MFGLIPIAVLLSGAVGVIVLKFVPRGTGFAWIYSVFCSLAGWLLFLVTKSNLPYLYSGNLYSDISINTNFPAFQIDIIVWPAILMVLAVVAGTILASAARIGYGATNEEWAGILLVGVLGIGACASQNVLTVLIFLSIFDFLELYITLSSKEQKKGNFLFLFWRFLSLFTLFAVFAWSTTDTKNLNNWETLLPVPTLLTLLACIMRLGIFPTKILSGELCNIGNGLDLSRNLIEFIVSATIVLQLPVIKDNQFTLSIILIYLLISGILSLFQIKIQSTGFTSAFWLSTGGAIICAEYLYGFSASAIFFLVAFVQLVFILFQPTRSRKATTVIVVLAILSFSGLPFTPNNFGLNGFGLSGSIPGFLFLAILIPFFYLLLSKFFEVRKEIINIERWAETIAPIGSVILMASSWLVFLIWQPNSKKYYLSIQTIIMTIGGTAIFLAVRYKLFNPEPELRKIAIIYQHFLDRIPLPRYTVFKSVYTVINKSYFFLINLFESDGGILWSILCLVLIITIINGTGLN